MVIDPNVQQKDIEYLSKGMDSMVLALARLEGKIDGMTQSYARKDEVDKEHIRLDDKINLLKEAVEHKVDKDEFKPYKDNFTWAMRIIIGAILMGMLALVGINQF